MRFTKLCIVGVLVCGTAHAQSVRDYMIRAIDVGEVSGPLTDATATAWRQTTGSSAPVMVKVIPVKTFKQEGCKRLNVTLYQEGVPTKEGGAIKAALPFEINLCRDGSAPLEAVDLEQLRRRALEAQQRAKKPEN